MIVNSDVMRKVSLQTSRKSTGESRTVEAELGQDEVERLQAYYKHAEDLTSLSALRNGMPGSLTIRSGKSKGLNFNSSLPPEESIYALLHKLRRFILNDEYGSCNEVTGILNKRFADPEIRSLIKAQRQIYEGREFQRQVKVMANVIVVNSEQVLQDWLNGTGEFHNAQTKKQKMQKLNEMIPLGASRTLFYMQLSDKVSAILTIADWVGSLLEEESIT